MKSHYVAAAVILTSVIAGCTGGKANQSPPPSAQAPAPAPAARQALYKGKVQRGYDISFLLSPDGKQVSKIQAHVLESCTGSSTTSTVTFYMEGPFPVGADGTLTAEEQDPTTKYTSKFTAAFTKEGAASGTLIQKGAMAGTVCTTYELKWDAAKE